MKKHFNKVIITIVFVALAIIVILGASGNLEKFTGKLNAGRATYTTTTITSTNIGTLSTTPIACISDNDCAWPDEVCGLANDRKHYCTKIDVDEKGDLCVSSMECKDKLICIGNAICGEDPIKVASGTVTFTSTQFGTVDIDLVNGAVPAGRGTYVGDKGFDLSKPYHIKTIGRLNNNNILLDVTSQKLLPGLRIGCGFTGYNPSTTWRTCTVEWIAIQKLDSQEIKTLTLQLSGFTPEEITNLLK